MDFPSLEGQGSSALGCLSVMWRQGDFCLVSRNKQAGSLCRAPEVRNLFWCSQLQDHCPCFRCLWGHVVLCPSAGTKLGHNYLSLKLLSLMYWLWGSKVISTSLVLTAEAMSDLFCQLNLVHAITKQGKHRHCITAGTELAKCVGV